MSVDPTQTITIDRTGLELDPLVFSARLDGTVLGLVNYQPPAMISRLGYMPDHPDVDGSELTSASWQKALLNFDWMADQATTETIVQAAYYEVLAAIAQFSFLVTTKVSDAPEQIWTADRGSMTPAGRTLIDTQFLRPVYAVQIPVQPIPGA